MVTHFIEIQEVKIVGVARHFSQVNPKLFDIGIMDNLIEMKPPSKEQRYEVLKKYSEQYGLQFQDIKL